MKHHYDAKLIAQAIWQHECEGMDPQEALQTALNDYLPGHGDAYKADLFARLLDNYDGRIGMDTMYIAAQMEEACG